MQLDNFRLFVCALFSRPLFALRSGLLANRLTIILILFLAAAASAPRAWAATVPKSTQQTVPSRDRLHLPLVALMANPFDPIRLTASEGIIETEPAWSPDGTQLAFHQNTSEVEGQDGGIYTILADGSQSKQVVRVDYSGAVAWSPDGSKLVFEGFMSYKNVEFNIYLLIFQPDGSTSLISLTADDKFNTSSSWTPDGRRIIFQRKEEPDEVMAIYAINIDGSGLTKLSKDPTQSYHFPKLSPDGTKIAFVRPKNETYCYRDATYPISSSPPPPSAQQIYIMNADGSNPTAVTPLGCNLDPLWSPDSSKIYFLSAPNYITDIYVVNSDGTQMTNLTNDEAIEADAQISPDGSKLLYWAIQRIQVPGESDAYHASLVLMDIDGSQKTYIAEIDSDPNPGGIAWSPDGSKFAYTAHNDLFVIKLDE